MEDNNIIEVPEKKKSKGCKILRTIIIASIIYSIIMGIIKLICKLKTTKREAKNAGKEYREYYSYLDGRNIKEAAGIFKSTLLKNVMGAIRYDISACTFSDDAFLSVSSYFGAVHIIVPKGTNVKYDGLFNNSASKYDAAEYDEHKSPTLYITVNSHFGAIKVEESNE